MLKRHKLCCNLGRCFTPSRGVFLGPVRSLVLPLTARDPLLSCSALCIATRNLWGIVPLGMGLLWAKVSWVQWKLRKEKGKEEKDKK